MEYCVLRSSAPCVSLSSTGNQPQPQPPPASQPVARSTSNSKQRALSGDSAVSTVEAVNSSSSSPFIRGRDQPPPQQEQAALSSLFTSPLPSSSLRVPASSAPSSLRRAAGASQRSPARKEEASEEGMDSGASELDPSSSPPCSSRPSPAGSAPSRALLGMASTNATAADAAATTDLASSGLYCVTLPSSVSASASPLPSLLHHHRRGHASSSSSRLDASPAPMDVVASTTAPRNCQAAASSSPRSAGSSRRHRHGHSRRSRRSRRSTASRRSRSTDDDVTELTHTTVLPPKLNQRLAKGGRGIRDPKYASLLKKLCRKEFRRVCRSGPKPPRTWSDKLKAYPAATSYAAYAKNRYRDVLAIESTRVALQGVECDYINGNYVCGWPPHGTNSVLQPRGSVPLGPKYVAAQAPLPNTMADFWLMVWQQRSCVIVMLTRLVEKGCLKAHAYWPQDVGGVVQHDSVEVTLVSRMRLSNIGISTIRIRRRVSALRHEATAVAAAEAARQRAAEAEAAVAAAARERGSKGASASMSGSVGVKTGCITFAASLHSSSSGVASMHSSSRGRSQLRTAGSSVMDMALTSSAPASEEDMLSYESDSSDCETPLATSLSSSSSSCVGTEEMWEERTVYHLHYTEWPDFGVPPSTACLRNLIAYSSLYSARGRSRGLNGPIITHCSAGIGRTGTFIAVDIGIAMLEQQCVPDVPQIIETLRTQRMGMVQTEAQYLFIYEALNDYIAEAFHPKRPRRCASVYSLSAHLQQEDDCDDNDDGDDECVDTAMRGPRRSQSTPCGRRKRSVSYSGS